MFGHQVVVAVVGAVSAVTLAGPSDNVRIVDEIAYPTPRARRLWQPMAGSADVSVVRLDGRAGLKLPCNFHGTRIERASWDRKIALDLTRAKGLRFLFHCRDASGVSHFTVYLHSGGGWYRGNFAPPAGRTWGRKLPFRRAMRPAAGRWPSDG